MRIKADLLLAAFVLVAVIYSLAWFGLHRLLRRGFSFGRSNPEPPPIEVTTPEERARGERSFATLKERTFGIAPAGFFALVAIGYALIAGGIAIAFFLFGALPTT
jgi:hypothetical protein